MILVCVEVESRSNERLVDFNAMKWLTLVFFFYLHQARWQQGEVANIVNLNQPSLVTTPAKRFVLPDCD